MVLDYSHTLFNEGNKVILNRNNLSFVVFSCQSKKSYQGFMSTKAVKPTPEHEPRLFHHGKEMES